MTLFHSKRGEQLRLEGMGHAADNAKEYLALAREVAASLAKVRLDGCITADDVGRVLKVDHGLDSLGPAAGSLFRTDDWQWTGEFRKSSRITNHSRLLRVWRYIGPVTGDSDE
jgi:hypothetical protein